jgi:desulfoferrodoxin-like iron-binding protein
MAGLCFLGGEAVDQEQDGTDVCQGFQPQWHNCDIAWEPTFQDQKSVDETYCCSGCGSEVQVVRAGGGILWCCGRPMELKDLGGN